MESPARSPIIIVSEAKAAALANCELVLDRLQAVIDEENNVLSRQEARPHVQFAERKHQLLRDLMSAQRACRNAMVLRSLSPKCERLKAALSRNERLLNSHMRALGEVSSIIIDCIKQTESDGTYSRQSARVPGRQC